MHENFPDFSNRNYSKAVKALLLSHFFHAHEHTRDERYLAEFGKK